MPRMSIATLILCIGLLGSSGVAGAQDVPSNAELYRMLQELSAKLGAVAGENLELKQRLKETSNALRDTRQELEQAKRTSIDSAAPPSLAAAQARGKDEEPRSRWSLGAQVLFLSLFDTGHAFSVTRTGSLPVPAFPRPSDLTTKESSFDHGFDPSPRVWLGYETKSGAGLRGTFWYSDHDEEITTGIDQKTRSVNASASAGAASTGAEGSGGVSGSFDVSALLPSGAPAISAGSTIKATQSIEFMTADLELTKRIETERPIFDFSAGLRYAMIDQTYKVQLVGTPLGPNISTFLQHDHDFHGFGPTAAFRMSYPDVFKKGLSLSGNLRGALLFGQRNHSIVGLPVGTNNGTVEKDDTVGTLGLGLGLAYRLQDMPSNLEVDLELGWEGQYWFNAYDANLDSGDIGLQGAYFGGRARW